MTKTLLKILTILTLIAPYSMAQIGLGIKPKAFFNVPGGRTVLFGNDSSGTGTLDPKLIWYGSQGALRAGVVSTSNWNHSGDKDNSNVGQYSFAWGQDTKASGDASTAGGQDTKAIGNASTASGYASTAMGYATNAGGYGAVSTGGFSSASANYATAIGYQTTASGEMSTAMGQFSTASQWRATAMGYQTTASGIASTAIGNQTTASGENAASTGYKTTASGDFSTAMGANVSTNYKPGSFIIGDKNTDGNVYNNSANNQMMMRFGGGYILYTTNGPYSAGTALGVQLASGGNAWQTISDSTRKENFREANGSDFLQKIANMRLGSWNYKGQDAKMYRHYGPMAQDFFAAFGQDELGTIGEDKSINQADFDGVNLIAIQALIKKVERLEAENAVLKQQVAETASSKTDMEQIKKQLATLLKQ